MRKYLNVPFSKKDEAKAFGAKWDAAVKKWYAPPECQLEELLKWMPEAGRKPKEKKRPVAAKRKAPKKREYKEKTMAAGSIKIWTDGSCNPNPGPGGWGWCRDDGKCARGGEMGTTNNRMELSAIIEALQELPDGEYAAITTDSLYCIKGIYEWGTNWKKNNWYVKGEPIKNRELWMTLNAELKRLHVTLHWVRGHNGDKMNEWADRLANEGRLAAILAAGLTGD